jgi:transposase
LAEWITKAELLGIPELKNFAAGLHDDREAVATALSSPWSNGPAEGQVTALQKRNLGVPRRIRLFRAADRDIMFPTRSNRLKTIK